MAGIAGAEEVDRVDATHRLKKPVRLTGIRLPGVPMFNYHGLAESIPVETPVIATQFCLSASKFRSHLAHIRDNGFQPVLLDTLKDRTAHATHSSRNVALTFDDGLMTDYAAGLPLLEEFGMKATFFLNTATVGRVGYLDWSKVVEMQRLGMSIQSHSHRHVDLTVLPTAALDAELAESKKRLEDRLGTRVEFLAAPCGLLNRRVVERAIAAGYHAVCSTRCLPARPGSTVLTRITLHRGILIGEFHSLLAGEIWPYARRLSRGLLLRPLNMAGHLYDVLRHRWLKQPTIASQ